MRTKLLKRKNALKQRRIKRIRAVVSGTAQMPRIALYKSTRALYAQAINDVDGTTLASVDGKKMGQKVNKEAAAVIAAEFANNLKAKGIEKVVLDRRGNKYHGVVAAFADALRENGIKL